MTTLRRARALVLSRVLAGVASLTACMTSRSPESIPQATSPFGEDCAVTLVSGRSVAGELLAVTDTSWILLVRNRVASARTGAISVVRVDGVADNFWYANGGSPPPTALQRARLAARFPHGISSQAMATLLARSSQSAPDDLERLPP